MEHFGHQTVRARKVHECTNCGADIPLGTKYLRQCVADCGMLQTVKTHPKCAELYSVLGCDEATDWVSFREDCYAYGGRGPFPWEFGYHAE